MIRREECINNGEIVHQSKLLPFLRWPGGKRWLTKRYPNFFPTSYNRYFEPFLGGGAVFFFMRPKAAVLSDINSDLISTYIAIKKDCARVKSKLERHQIYHSTKYYYYMRERPSHNIFDRAARFIYLNRTCFNGLYRVNKHGVFNVPKGSKTKVVFPEENFYGISACLRDVELLSNDFSSVINRSADGDFVFIDPPYTIQHNHNNFRKYNEKIFSWDDQIRLSIAVKCAVLRGVKILLCNACHSSVRELYEDIGKIEIVERYSILAANSKKRNTTHEMIVLCNM